MATMPKPLIKVQEFQVYNKVHQRLMFRGLIIPANEMRVTTDSLLFRDEDMRKAMDAGAVEVVPDPRTFYSGDSSIPEAVESSGGGGPPTGDGNILRTFRNADSFPFPRGTPIYSPGSGQAFGALGNLSGRLVIGLYAGDADLGPGGSGNFLVEGTLFSSTAEWEAITDMPGGLVRGQKYFLDLLAPGKLRLNVPLVGAPSPSYQVCVGYALTATEFKLEVQSLIRIA